jgi:hypothetical protein
MLVPLRHEQGNIRAKPRTPGNLIVNSPFSSKLSIDIASNEDPVSAAAFAGRKLERLVSLNDFRRVIFGPYPGSGLTPDGSPLLM